MTMNQKTASYLHIIKALLKIMLLCPEICCLLIYVTLEKCFNANCESEKNHLGAKHAVQKG